MSESKLEQVKKLVEQLSPEDRIQLWHFISELPDSGIQSGNLAAPETTLDGAQVGNVNPDLPIIVSTDTSATIFLRSREIFQVTFRPENFRQSRMEVYSWKDAPPSERIKGQLREILSLHGAPEPTDEDLIAASKAALQEVFEADTFRTSNEFSARLKHMVWLLYDGGMKIVELGWRNDFARQSGQRVKTLDEIVKELEPYWKQIKTHLNLAPGGRQNVKHQWSIKDHTCLAVHYDRLKPIWREAKKTARDALKSKDSTRRKNWKEQVMAAYKDEEFPVDLVEQLAPSVNSQPADLALIHAARRCLPVSYSTKILKAKLREFNPVPKPSREAGKNKGTS